MAPEELPPCQDWAPAGQRRSPSVHAVHTALGRFAAHDAFDRGIGPLARAHERSRGHVVAGLVGQGGVVGLGAAVGRGEGRWDVAAEVVSTLVMLAPNVRCAVLADGRGDDDEAGLGVGLATRPSASGVAVDSDARAFGRADAQRTRGNITMA